MKVVFLTDYFYPFVHGGAEVSIMELGKDLARQGIGVFLLTPNYGAKEHELISGIHVKRYAFPVKLRATSGQLTPNWHFNPIYWFLLTRATIKIVQENNINIVHAQSSAAIIPAVLAGKLLGKPVIVTFRDNQILCNYGFCLAKHQFHKTCDLKSFIEEDFQHYYQDKVKRKNFIVFAFQLLLALQGRFRSNVLRAFVKLTKVQVVGSIAQQKTFAGNGFTKTRVINNIFHFSKLPKAQATKSNILLYATKLSSGKGLDLLLHAFVKLKQSFPKLTLLIVGGGDQARYHKLTENLGISDSVNFTGVVENSKVQTFRSKALLEITPSIYPESFGRSALEALGAGVPVVASNRGGLTDIVENDITGVVVEPTEADLTRGIIKAIKENATLRKNIRTNFDLLNFKFETKPVEDHIILYTSIL